MGAGGVADPEVRFTATAEAGVVMLAGLGGRDLHHHGDAQRRQGLLEERQAAPEVGAADTYMVEHDAVLSPG